LGVISRAGNGPRFLARLCLAVRHHGPDRSFGTVAWFIYFRFIRSGSNPFARVQLKVLRFRKSGLFQDRPQRVDLQLTMVRYRGIAPVGMCHDRVFSPGSSLEPRAFQRTDHLRLLVGIRKARHCVSPAASGARRPASLEKPAPSRSRPYRFRLPHPAFRLVRSRPAAPRTAPHIRPHRCHA